MIAFTVNQRKINELAKVLEGSDKKIRRQMATVTNKTSKKVRSRMAKEIGRELATTQKLIKETITIPKKAHASQTLNRVSATVRESRTRRIPLRNFGARQNKSGVSFRVSKKQGRKHVAGAFQGPKPGVMKASWRGRVFKRVGKKRLPIVQLFGASPWGVFVAQDMKPVIVAYAKAEQFKQLKERIRFLNLKKAGTI